MTRQRPPHLQLIAIDGKEVVGACHHAIRQYRSVDAFDLDSMERLVLSVTRHLCASLASEAIRGWECAHDLAEAALGLSDGPTLVAHIAALLRAVRAERRRGFAYMSADCPMCSLRITDEELLIVRLLRAARSNARQKVVQLAAALAQRNAALRIAGAALVLANRLATLAVVSELQAPLSEPPAATGNEQAGGSGGVFPFRSLAADPGEVPPP
jgi:hypothetical protein